MARLAVALFATWLAWMPLTSSAVMWILGEEGQSCSQACLQGCLEDEVYYPATRNAFEAIVRQVDAPCDRIVKGGMRYDPSISERECGYQQWRAMKWDFCGLTPPPTTARFCPCKGEPMPESYNCAWDVDNWQSGWSVGKQRWCCAHHDVGCPEVRFVNGSMTIATADPEAFLSQADIKGTLHRTIAAKAGVGIDVVALELMQVPSAQQHYKLRRLRELESTIRAEYSIRYLSNTTHTPDDVLSVTAAEWTELLHAALNSKLASDAFVVTAVGEVLHDCKAGYPMWKLGWSDSKKAWCCANEGVACDEPSTYHRTTEAPLTHGYTTAAPPSHDHGAGVDHYSCFVGRAVSPESDWSPDRRQWCCTHKHIACQDTTMLARNRFWDQVIIACLSILVVLIFVVLSRRAKFSEERSPRIETRPSCSELLAQEGEAAAAATVAAVEVHVEVREVEQKVGREQEERMRRQEEEEEQERRRRDEAEAELRATRAREAEEARRRTREAEAEAERLRRQQEEERCRKQEEDERRAKEAEEKAKKKGCFGGCSCSTPGVSEPGQPVPAPADQ